MKQTQDFRTGHRSRVKDRFLREGLDGFFDYEVLELLLFYAFAQKDTKTLAHSLIHRFGSLGAVLRADKTALCSVEGIGARTADFLHTLLPFLHYVACEEPPAAAFSSADALGRLFTAYYENQKEPSVDAAFFNNRGELLKLLHICNGPLGTADLTVQRLVAPAYACNAASMALAFYKRGGIAFPDGYELDTVRSLQSSLKSAGIYLLDAVMIAGGQYNPLMNYVGGTIRQEPYMEVGTSTPIQDRPYPSVEMQEKSKIMLERVLSAAVGVSDAFGIAQTLLASYPTVRTLLSMPYETLAAEEGVGAHTALFLKLLAALYSYEKTEAAKLCRTPFQTIDDLGNLFCGIHALRTTEAISMALLDQKDRLLDVRICAKGTVNAASYVPRTFVEHAVGKKAVKVAIAHNHPAGDTRPSEADRIATNQLREVFSDVGIQFVDHFVVTDREFLPLCHARTQE